MIDLNLEDIKSLRGSASIASDIAEMDSSSPRREEFSRRAAIRQVAEVTKILEIYEKKLQEAGASKWFIEGSPYGIDKCPRHAEFFRSGNTYFERLFMAGNRCGKSVSGAFETACHLTGLYPEWWEGRRFDHPVAAWAAGQTGQTTRDTCQKELLGPPGAIGTGMIPKELIAGTAVKQGVANAIELVKVKHVSGGISVLGFKSYDQGVKAFYGTAQHVVWLDEECPDLIYNECLIRTMTTSGILYVTFTPLHGITPFIVNFGKNANFLAGAVPITVMTEEEEEDQLSVGEVSSRAVIQAGWDHAPWLDHDTKERLLANTPPHLRDARRNGIPSIGSGNVYPIPVEEISCEDFPIPPEWPRWYGLDVGWNRTAAVWLAINPSDKQMYVFSEHYRGQAEPEVHAAAIKGRGEWMRGAIDPASRGRSQVDGRKLIDVYKKLGLRINEANNAVEGGIQAVWSALSSGKLKVFKSCVNLLREYMVYRRNLDGKIVKENDHLLDALRYAVNTSNLATHPPIGPGASKKGYANLGGAKYDI
jgi:phage terminase large subunit-like protein